MKILKLRFKNIHSLKGEHLIDFTVPPLSDAGLFAITGPTGAGKSTILDVITLALFNKMPRFASKGTESISRNDIEKIGSVLTHFTDDAYAEIEYECNKQRYRSKWSISRARTGNLRDYEMELASLSDNRIFDLKKSEIPAENERLLGLKYEQFIRSILLSQGDFARFLKSDEKERARLLEDITDSQIYRDIGRKVYESAKLIEEELKDIRLKADLIALFPDEILLQKKNALAESQLKLEQVNKEIEYLSALLIKTENKKQLFLKRERTLGGLVSLEQKKEAFAKNAWRLKRHQELDIHRGDLSLWLNDKERLSKLTKEISHYRILSATAADNLKQALEKMSLFTQSEVSEDNFMIQMKTFENRVIELDSQLQTLTLSGKALRERVLQLFDKNIDKLSISFQKVNTTEEQYQLAVTRKEQIEQVPVFFEGSNSELEQKIQHLNEKNITWTSMFKDIKSMEEIVAENTILSQHVGTNELLLQSTNQQGITYLEKLESTKTALETANRQKEEWLKIATFDDHRHALKDGEPCPLCGAKHHPYAENLPHKIGENEIHIQQLSMLLVADEKTYQDIKTKAAVLESTIQNHAARIIENGVRIQQIQNLYPENTMNSVWINSELEQNKLLLQQYKEEARIRSEKELLDEIITILAELQAITSQFRLAKQARTALYGGNDINGDADKIQNVFVSAKENFQSLAVTIKNTEKEIATTKEKWDKLTENLTMKISLLGYSNPEEAISHIIPDEALRQIILENEGLIKEETELNATLKQLETEINELKDILIEDEQISKLKLDIETFNNEKDLMHQGAGAIQNELNNQAQLKIQYESLKGVILKLEIENKPLFHLNVLIGDATGTKYAKFAQNLNLKHLISLANGRLSKLTDRYLLADTDIEDDLKVTDLYQGNTQRSVKTLSGGETFIVSLAMALSLADMASHNVKLDSLFIDEGFGTLDQETMEVALITLEKLQSEGNRTIGIISHVESLKERINTQIKVHKDSQGYSKIEIVQM